MNYRNKEFLFLVSHKQLYQTDCENKRYAREIN
jgi:hypothetical protein